PVRAVLLLQKEVAEKLCASQPRMNVLALHVQTFGRPQILAAVSRHNFRPEPRVDSAIVRIDFPQPAQKFLFSLQDYFALIHRAFSQKRKMLRATLPVELLTKAAIEPTRRPETMTIDEWKRLACAE
ncbi:16S rRNA (adenine(1518)-N(6)/adenine(1519)-N(6))-dimethyltransferase RsmA, partial [Candidatus Peregrinibacteria bacterium]|nr:16S rRNA (adenine(1518)-N(6)/adenine(1519)-N(6))-dimethyltransferase RsmA [Candidatus Peregrinibacteria bacterium]